MNIDLISINAFFQTIVFSFIPRSVSAEFIIIVVDVNSKRSLFCVCIEITRDDAALRKTVIDDVFSLEGCSVEIDERFLKGVEFAAATEARKPAHERERDGVTGDKARVLLNDGGEKVDAADQRHLDVERRDERGDAEPRRRHPPLDVEGDEEVECDVAAQQRAED